MDNQIKITKQELIKVAGYKPKEFPKYTASLMNLLNRWARGTASNVVGQMSDEVMECPHKDYDKWKEWYLNKHPKAIDNAVKLVMSKLQEVKEGFDQIDENLVRLWIEDLVIDKSFWGLKIQEAILKKLEKLTGMECRLANKEEESKGYDGFVGDLPVQIKPDSFKVASNVKTETFRAKPIYYYKDKDTGNYLVDISEIKEHLKQDS